MNPHPKYRTNQIYLLPVVRWVVIAAFLSAAGLSYVYLTIQLHSCGLQRTALEKNLHELIVQNNVLEAQITNLTSRTALQHQLDVGFIKLVPIGAQAIVHVRPQDAGRRLNATRDQESQFQTVSREGYVQP